MKGFGFFNRLFQRAINLIRRISIFKRLIVFLLLLIIIPNLIIGYVSFDKSSKTLDKTISDSLFKYAGTVDRNVTERLRRYEDLSYKLYLNENLNEWLQQCHDLKQTKKQIPENTVRYHQIKKALNSLLFYSSSTFDYIMNIEIVTPDDEFTQINLNGEQKGGYLRNITEFRNSELFKKAIVAKGGSVWSESTAETSVFGTQFKEAYLGPTISILRSIPSDDKMDSLGVIVINISVKVFYGIYDKDDWVDRGNLLLIGKTGTIFSLNENIHGPILDKETSKEILKLKSGSFIKKINNQPCLVVFDESNISDWKIVILIPHESLLTSVYQIRDMIIAISIICIFVAVLIAFFLTFSISKPIRQLKQTMEMVNDKKLDIIYYDSSNDEISALGRNFNGMIANIKELINTLYKAELIKKNEELKRKKAELDALQMQINPHFLYNTLDIIRWEVALGENGDGKGSKMIKAFADLLRLGTKKGEELVSLEEELNHVRAYIKVMEFKQGEQIKIVFDIKPETLKCLLTKLSLQPIVENAILHGLLQKQGEKLIKIHTTIEKGCLVIVVEDTGVGISKDILDKFNNHLVNNDSGLKSIGLKNVNDRLRLYFGDEFKLKINSNLGEGTQVIMRIPQIKKPKISEGEEDV